MNSASSKPLDLRLYGYNGTCELANQLDGFGASGDTSGNGVVSSEHRLHFTAIGIQLLPGHDSSLKRVSCGTEVAKVAYGVRDRCRRSKGCWMGGHLVDKGPFAHTRFEVESINPLPCKISPLANISSDEHRVVSRKKLFSFSPRRRFSAHLESSNKTAGDDGQMLPHACTHAADTWLCAATNIGSATMRELPILFCAPMVSQSGSACHSDRPAAPGHLRRPVGILFVCEGARLTFDQGLDVGILRKVRATIVDTPHPEPLIAVARNRQGHGGHPEFTYRKGQRHA